MRSCAGTWGKDTKGMLPSPSGNHNSAFQENREDLSERRLLRRRVTSRTREDCLHALPEGSVATSSWRRAILSLLVIYAAKA